MSILSRNDDYFKKLYNNVSRNTRDELDRMSGVSEDTIKHKNNLEDIELGDSDYDDYFGSMFKSAKSELGLDNKTSNNALGNSLFDSYETKKKDGRVAEQIARNKVNGLLSPKNTSSNSNNTTNSKDEDKPFYKKIPVASDITGGLIGGVAGAGRTYAEWDYKYDMMKAERYKNLANNKNLSEERRQHYQEKYEEQVAQAEYWKENSIKTAEKMLDYANSFSTIKEDDNMLVKAVKGAFGSLGNIATATIAGGGNGIIGMGVSTYGQGLEEAKDMNLSEEDTHKYALSTAFIESGSELFFPGAKGIKTFLTTGSIKQAIKEAGVSNVKEFVKQIGEEFGQEAATEVANIINERRFEDKDGNPIASNDWRELGERIMVAGLSGAIMGGVTEGAASLNKANNNQTQNSVLSQQEEANIKPETVSNTVNQQNITPENANKAQFLTPQAQKLNDAFGFDVSNLIEENINENAKTENSTSEIVNNTIPEANNNIDTNINAETENNTIFKGKTIDAEGNTVYVKEDGSTINAKLFDLFAESNNIDVNSITRLSETEMQTATQNESIDSFIETIEDSVMEEGAEATVQSLNESLNSGAIDNSTYDTAVNLVNEINSEINTETQQESVQNNTTQHDSTQNNADTLSNKAKTIEEAVNSTNTTQQEATQGNTTQQEAVNVDSTQHNSTQNNVKTGILIPNGITAEQLDKAYKQDPQLKSRMEEASKVRQNAEAKLKEAQKEVKKQAEAVNKIDEKVNKSKTVKEVNKKAENTKNTSSETELSKLQTDFKKHNDNLMSEIQEDQAEAEKYWAEEANKEYLDKVEKLNKVVNGKDFKVVFTNLKLEAIEKLTVKQDAVNELGKAIGREVIFFKANSKNAPNGFMKNGIIFLNGDYSGSAMTQVLGHETFHTLKTTNKETFNKLVEYGKENFTAEEITQFLSKIDNTAEVNKLKNNPDLLSEEMLAEAFGNDFANKEFWQGLEKKNKSLFEKIKDIIAKIFNRAKSYKTDFLTQKHIDELRVEFEGIFGDLTNNSLYGEFASNDVAESLQDTYREETKASKKKNLLKTETSVDEKGVERITYFGSKEVAKHENNIRELNDAIGGYIGVGFNKDANVSIDDLRNTGKKVLGAIANEVKATNFNVKVKENKITGVQIILTGELANGQTLKLTTADMGTTVNYYVNDERLGYLPFFNFRKTDIIADFKDAVNEAVSQNTKPEKVLAPKKKNNTSSKKIKETPKSNLNKNILKVMETAKIEAEKEVAELSKYEYNKLSDYGKEKLDSAKEFLSKYDEYLNTDSKYLDSNGRFNSTYENDEFVKRLISIEAHRIAKDVYKDETYSELSGDGGLNKGYKDAEKAIRQNWKESTVEYIEELKDKAVEEVEAEVKNKTSNELFKDKELVDIYKAFKKLSVPFEYSEHTGYGTADLLRADSAKELKKFVNSLKAKFDVKNVKSESNWTDYKVTAKVNGKDMIFKAYQAPIRNTLKLTVTFKEKVNSGVYKYSNYKNDIADVNKLINMIEAQTSKKVLAPKKKNNTSSKANKKTENGDDVKFSTREKQTLSSKGKDVIKAISTSKTPSEIKNILKEKYDINFSTNNMDIKLAQEYAKKATELADRYIKAFRNAPEANYTGIQGISDYTGLHGLLSPKKANEIADKSYGVSAGGEDFHRIFLNHRTTIEDLKAVMSSSIRKDFNPKRTKTSSILTHEIGHSIHHLITKNDKNSDVNKKLKDIYNKNLSDMNEKLSEYGQSDFDEFVAEAFSEYFDSPTPRNVAIQVGNIIDEELGLAPLHIKTEGDMKAEEARYTEYIDGERTINRDNVLDVFNDSIFYHKSRAVEVLSRQSPSDLRGIFYSLQDKGGIAENKTVSETINNALDGIGEESYFELDSILDEKYDLWENADNNNLPEADKLFDEMVAVENAMSKRKEVSDLLFETIRTYYETEDDIRFSTRSKEETAKITAPLQKVAEKTNNLQLRAGIHKLQGVKVNKNVDLVGIFNNAIDSMASNTESTKANIKTLKNALMEDGISSKEANAIAKYFTNIIDVAKETFTETTPVSKNIITSSSYKGKSKGIKAKTKEAFDRFYTHIADTNHAGKMVNNVFYNKAKTTKNSFGIVDNIFTEALTDKNGNVVDKSLKEMFSNVFKADDIIEFMDYVLHKHNISRALQGKYVFFKEDGSPMESTDSAKIVKQYEAKHPDFASRQEELTGWINTFFETWAVDTGLMTKDFHSMLKEMYNHYVPTNRSFADHEELFGGGYGGKGFVDKSKPTKRAEKGGSARDIIDLQESIVNLVSKTVRTAKMNEVGQELVKAVENNPNMKGIAEIVDKPDINVDNVVRVLVKGEPVYVEVHNKSLLEMLEQVHTPEFHAVVEMSKKTLNVVKQLITSKNPLFAITNTFRDYQTYMINSTEANVFKRWGAIGKALKAIKNNTKEYQLYKAMGISSSGMMAKNNTKTVQNITGLKSIIDKDTGALLGKKDINNSKDLKSRFTKGWNKFNEAIETLTGTSETTFRLAEFINSLDRGLTVEEATVNAMEVTVDFSRSGDYTRFADASVMYLNAGVQGLDRVARQVKKHPIQTLTRSMVHIAAPAIMLAALNGGDDDYEMLDSRTKDNNFLIPLWLFGGEEGKFLKLPKAREYGVVAMLCERLIYGRGEEGSFDNLWRSVKENMAPADVFTSNILTDIAKATDNEAKDFAGRYIVPKALQDKEDKEAKDQWDDDTTVLAKYLGQLLNFSPKFIDYYLDSYTGIVGDLVMPILTPSTYASGDSKDATSNILAPITKKFVADNAYSSSATSKYYDNLDELTKVIKKEQEGLTTAEKKKLTTETEAFKSAINEAYGNDISDFNDMLKDDSLTNSEKRKIRQARNEAMKQANEAIKKFLSPKTK